MDILNMIRIYYVYIYIWDIFAVCIVCAGILLTVVLSMNLPHGFLHSPGHDTPYTLWDGVHHPLDPPGSFGQSCVLLVGLVQVPVSVGSMIPCNVDGYTILYYTILYTYIHTCIHTHTYTYTHTDIQTYRNTDIQTYRNTDIQTYRHTDIQTYRHTDIQTYIHTYIYTYCVYKLYILCFIMIAYVNTCIIFKDIWYIYIYIYIYTYNGTHVCPYSHISRMVQV